MRSKLKQYHFAGAFFVFATLTKITISRAIQEPDPVPQDEMGYETAVQIMAVINDWATEEIIIKDKTVNPRKNDWDFMGSPWAVRLRGKDKFNIWYPDAECMGMLVTPRTVFTLCACVYSWYSSFKNGTEFKRAPMRDVLYDISTEDIFVYFVNHGSNYYRDEDIHYHQIIIPLLKSDKCDEATQSNETAYKQYDAFVLLELNVPALINETMISIPQPFNDRPSHDGVTVRVLSYGTTVLDETHIFTRESDGQLIQVQDEEVAVRLTKASQKCREPYNWNVTGYECWQPTAKDLCGVLPGSPIIEDDGTIMGITMSYIQCPKNGSDPGTLGPVEVRRLATSFTAEVDVLVAEHEKLMNMIEHNTASATNKYDLFNYTPAAIHYDEDFDSMFAKLDQISIRDDGIIRSASELAIACVLTIDVLLLYNYIANQ